MDIRSLKNIGQLVLHFAMLFYRAGSLGAILPNNKRIMKIPKTAPGLLVPGSRRDAIISKC